MTKAEPESGGQRGVFYSSATSPFARKVRIAMILRSVTHLFDEIDYNPFLNGSDFLAASPIGQVPALLTANGEAVIGSALICAYLDTLGSQPPLASLPTVRWDALCRQAVADGIMECSVRFRAERELRRPGERSDYWMTRWQDAILRGLDHLDANLPPAGTVDIGLIATACAALYLDLRHADLDWRDGRDALAARVEELAAQDAFKQTDPAVAIPHHIR